MVDKGVILGSQDEWLQGFVQSNTPAQPPFLGAA